MYFHATLVVSCSGEIMESSSVDRGTTINWVHDDVHVMMRLKSLRDVICESYQSSIET